MDSAPRRKNGSAAHSTTGVASASSIQTAARSPSQSRSGRPTIGPMVMTSSGMRQHGADPQAPGEVDQLRVRAFVAGRHAHRLQRHAADRAGAGLVADDLRMHRAGVLRALRHRRRRGTCALVFARRCLELLLASGRAEIVGVSFMAQEMPCTGAIDLHAADRVDGLDEALRLRPGISRDRTRRRNERRGPHVRLTACPHADRRSCRTPDRV